MVACNIGEEGCDGTCEAVDAYLVADNSQHMDYFDDSLIRPNHQASLDYSLEVSVPLACDSSTGGFVSWTAPHSSR